MSDEPDLIVGHPNYSADQLHSDLRNARERLCRAQTFVPPHWTSDVQMALNVIDQAGSALCPGWSHYNQPEYPEPKT